MTSNGSSTYTYDAENRMLAVGGTTYTYDGDGNRVKKSSGTLYWGAGPLAESDLTGSAASWNDYVFFSGKRVARRNASNLHYYFSDHLGSSDVVTSSTGTILQDMDYYPYGGTALGTSSDHYLFTGKERDAESGLDNFGARYNASGMGRFMTPDPLLSSGRPQDPQTWNRYSYARNNPLSIVDPTGLYDLNNTCNADDARCNKRFRQYADALKKGLADLQQKVDNMEDGPEKTRLQNALNAIGTEDDDNNVNVTFGSLPKNAAGNTAPPIINPNTGGIAGFNITLDPTKISGGTNYWAIDAAHEGTHV